VNDDIALIRGVVWRGTVAIGILSFAICMVSCATDASVHTSRQPASLDKTIPTASNDPRERLRLARYLAAEGRYAEATAEYIWCWDKANEHSVAVVRGLRELGAVYEPAMIAYNERRSRLVPAADDPDERYHYGQLLAFEGSYAEALDQYLWCWDQGSDTPRFLGVRVSFLLSDIARLAKDYPPAIDALRERRNHPRPHGSWGSVDRDIAALDRTLARIAAEQRQQ
jgi:tetratricopeptide (TPR) repeat protein